MTDDNHALKMLTDSLTRVEGKVDKLADAALSLVRMEERQSGLVQAQERLQKTITETHLRIDALDQRLDAIDSYRWKAAGVIAVVTFLATLFGADFVHAVFRNWN